MSPLSHPSDAGVANCGSVAVQMRETAVALLIFPVIAEYDSPDLDV